MKRHIAFLTAVILAATTFGGIRAPSASALGCTATDNQQKTKDSWNALPTGGRAQAEARAGGQNINTNDQNQVYEVARSERAMITMAIACNDDAFLKSIGEEWTPVLTSRLPFDTGQGLSFPTWQLQTPSGAFVENHAYMYLMLWNQAQILAYATSKPTRSAWQNAFVTRWAPVLRDHYRWQLFLRPWRQSANWAGPCEGPHNIPIYGTSVTGKEQQLVRMAMNDWGNASQNKEACNFTRDAEQMIQAGFAWLVRAAVNDPKIDLGMPLTAALKFVSVVNAYYWAKSITTVLSDLSGKPVVGRVLHPLTYRTLAEDSAWAGDEDASRPPSDPPCGVSRPQKPIAGVLGEDLQHLAATSIGFLEAQRSLNSVPGVTNQITDEVMVQYANQFAYGMSNRDKRFPEWKNFTGGPNGWYRPSYAGRGGFPPWESGTFAAVSGWFQWGAYNADIVAFGARWKEIWEAQPGSADYTWRLANLQPGGGKWSAACVYNPNLTLDVRPLNSYGAQQFYASLVPFGGVVDPLPPVTTTIITTTTKPPTTSVFTLQCSTGNGTIVCRS